MYSSLTAAVTNFGNPCNATEKSKFGTLQYSRVYINIPVDIITKLSARQSKCAEAGLINSE